MPRYCTVCCTIFEEERCPVCGRKSKRSVGPDDLCFLTEKAQIWSGMLADVLKQRDIPFIQKNVLGAGLTTTLGPMRERVRFYVLYKQLSEAKEVVDELFPQPDEENNI